jgi:hypothetical protein
MKRIGMMAAVGRSACAALAVAAIATAGAARAEDVRDGGIRHVMVITLENEDFSTTFGAGSPAVYLNQTLLPKGELLVNYFGTSHVSLGNYISLVSGQEPTVSTNNDCLNLASLSGPVALGTFNNVTPGTDAADQKSFPGQVVGDGCIYPAPSANTLGALTIGDQIDARFGASATPLQQHGHVYWREYAEDMGRDAARDHGDPDASGLGTDCAHPALNGDDLTNTAEAGDQYADRHAPFVYFHSIIDNQARCDAHVVPLGAVQINPVGPDLFTGPLSQDLQKEETTPAYMFVTPNLCDDGHDAVCHGTNIEGGKAGGLIGADLWLKHYMPMIFNSPAYKNGSLLVVVTFDEGAASDARACANADQSTCGSPIGPNVSNPGYSSLLGLFHVQTPPTQNYQYAGGGQIGAVLFNKHFIKPGSVNTTSYNHYSLLRTFEDLLGIKSGGADGQGHLGYAATATSFGSDVFNNR